MPGYGKGGVFAEADHCRCRTTKVVVDASSIELFADYGLSVMVALSFPNQSYKGLIIRGLKGARVRG